MKLLLLTLMFAAACRARAGCPPGQKIDPEDCAYFIRRTGHPLRSCGEGLRPCFEAASRCGWRCR